MASDDRGHGGPSPPVVLFRYAPGRSGAYAEQFLRGYHGRLLKCDGYDGYELLTRVKRDEGPWMLVHCREPSTATVRQACSQHKHVLAET